MRILLAATAVSALAGAAFAQSTGAPQSTPLNAPNGMPAAGVTTIASPPVHNPTDGQVDGQAHANGHAATAPRAVQPAPSPRASATGMAQASMRPTESSVAPAGRAEGGITESAPMPTDLNAPNGQRASGVIVVSAPPVRNPTDGRVDGPRAPK